ncbi:hypothetical protein [Vibrio phage BX-1]|nr:hypothetical protein [Vibrio phage BX-1]
MSNSFINMLNEQHLEGTVLTEAMITEAFDSEPYEFQLEAPRADNVYAVFTDEKGGEFRVQFYSGVGLGKGVRRVRLGKKKGASFSDANIKFNNPQRAIATMLAAAEEFFLTPIGKKAPGFAFEFTKKAAPRGVRVVRAVMKRKFRQKFDVLDSSFSPEKGKGFVWVVRKGQDAAKVFSGPKVAGLIGGNDTDPIVEPDPAPEPTDDNKLLIKWNQKTADFMLENIRPNLESALSFYGPWEQVGTTQNSVTMRFENNGYEATIGVNVEKLQYIFEGKLYKNINEIFELIKPMVQPIVDVTDQNHESFAAHLNMQQGIVASKEAGGVRIYLPGYNKDMLATFTEGKGWVLHADGKAEEFVSTGEVKDFVVNMKNNLDKLDSLTGDEDEDEDEDFEGMQPIDMFAGLLYEDLTVDVDSTGINWVVTDDEGDFEAIIRTVNYPTLKVDAYGVDPNHAYDGIEEAANAINDSYDLMFPEDDEDEEDDPSYMPRRMNDVTQSLQNVGFQVETDDLNPIQLNVSNSSGRTVASVIHKPTAFEVVSAYNDKREFFESDEEHPSQVTLGGIIKFVHKLNKTVPVNEQTVNLGVKTLPTFMELLNDQKTIEESYVEIGKTYVGFGRHADRGTVIVDDKKKEIGKGLFIIFHKKGEKRSQKLAAKIFDQRYKKA